MATKRTKNIKSFFFGLFRKWKIVLFPIHRSHTRCYFFCLVSFAIFAYTQQRKIQINSMLKIIMAENFFFLRIEILRLHYYDVLYIKRLFSIIVNWTMRFFGLPRGPQWMRLNCQKVAKEMAKFIRCVCARFLFDFEAKKCVIWKFFVTEERKITGVFPVHNNFI